MITCKEIEEYLEYAKKNPDRINEDRKLLIKNIVLPTLARDDVFFDEKTYQNCIKYCEKHYYKLFPYQKFVYAFAFMYKDDAPIFSNFFIMMGRGNGKDGFIVPLVNFFQTPLYGIKKYHVEIVANAEDQAKETFKIAYEALNTNAMKMKFDVTKELITNKQTGSELKYNTSEAKTKDGKRPGALILNEVHAYENYDQINVFESALGKKEHPREFILTTQGYVREGPLDDWLDLMEGILKTGENPLEWFPFICRLDSKEEIDIEEAWHKANPSMEFMPILTRQIKKDYLSAKRLKSKWPEFVTKRCNLPERNEEETAATWEQILKCCYINVEKKIERIERGEARKAILAIDYADVRDFATAGRLTKEGDEFVWRKHTWICEESPFLDSIKFPIRQNVGMEGYGDYEIVKGPTIKPELLVEWCIERMHEFNVQKITMDTWRYSMFRELFGQRGILEETKKNKNELLRLIRNTQSACGVIAPEVEKLFAEEKINFGNSAMMRWFVNNTKVTTEKSGNKKYEKVEPKLRKNDGFMAFLIAMYSKELLNEVTMYV